MERTRRMGARSQLKDLSESAASGRSPSGNEGTDTLRKVLRAHSKGNRIRLSAEASEVGDSTDSELDPGFGEENCANPGPLLKLTKPGPGASVRAVIAPGATLTVLRTGRERWAASSLCCQTLLLPITSWDVRDTAGVIKARETRNESLSALSVDTRQTLATDRVFSATQPRNSLGVAAHA